MQEICDKWKTNPLINPRTLRKIKENGSVYKKLQIECDQFNKPNNNHNNKNNNNHNNKNNNNNKPENYLDQWKQNPLINPRTLRPIKINGTVYKRLQAEFDLYQINKKEKEEKEEKERIEKKEKKEKTEKKERTENKEKTEKKERKERTKKRKIDCSSKGLEQRSGTCWFNTALNGLILGEHSSYMLQEMLARVVPTLSAQKQDFLSSDTFQESDTCPIKLNKIFVYKYLLYFFCYSNSNGIERLDNGLDHARQIMKLTKINHRPLIIKTGWFASKAIPQLLGFFYNTNEISIICHSKLQKTMFVKSVDTATKYVIIVNSVKLHKFSFNVPFVEKEITINGLEYVLDHAAIFLHQNKISENHLIVSYTCNGDEYIYDSNNYESEKVIWTSDNMNQNIKDLYKNTEYNIKKAEFDYICYVRKSDQKPNPNVLNGLCSLKAKLEKKKIKTVLYHILGMGCSEATKSDLKQYQEEIQETTGISDVRVRCNPSMTSTIINIIKSVCMVPLKNDKFVNEIFSEIKLDISNGSRVIVFGHSYGGAVTTRLAELFNEMTGIYGIDAIKNNIVFRTCGSIYISNREKLRNVDIKHIIYNDDVCLKCNGLANNEARDNVIWKPSPIKYVAKIGDKMNLLGTDTQWNIHNSYDFYMFPEISNTFS